MSGEKATEFIRVAPSTKKKLTKLGKKNDSYDDIIRRLLDAQKC